MPVRSNDYQRVVYYIQQKLAPDARVTESAMLTDGRTGEPREVDVLVEGTVGGCAIAIGIEVRDHGRKATVQWVDQVRGKYEDLPVHKVVLISRSGFSERALVKARALGMEPVMPSQEVSDIGSLAALRVEIWLAHVVWKGMSGGTAWMDGQSEPAPVVAETLLFTHDGVEVMTVAKFTTEAILHQPDPCAPTESGDVRIYATLDTLRARNKATGEDVELMLRSEPDGVLHHVDKMNVVWEATLDREPVELEHGGLHGMPFAFGSFGLSTARRLIIVNPADEAEADNSFKEGGNVAFDSLQNPDQIGRGDS